MRPLLRRVEAQCPRLRPTRPPPPWRPHRRVPCPTHRLRRARPSPPSGQSSPFLPFELVVLPRQVLALDAVACDRLGDTFIVDLHPKARTLDRSPPGAARDRDRLGEDVVLHQVRSLLMPLDAVGQGQDDMMAGCRGEPKLPVGVLADLKPFEVRQPGESVKTPDRSDPVGREAIDICVSRPDVGVDVCLRPETFVGADSRVDPGAHLCKLPYWVIPDRLLDEIDVVLAHSSEIPQSLWNRPASVRIEPEPGPRTELLAHG